MFFSYPVFRPKSPPDCLWPQSVRAQVERRAGAGLRIMNYAAHAVRLSRGGRRRGWGERQAPWYHHRRLKAHASAGFVGLSK